MKHPDNGKIRKMGDYKRIKYEITLFEFHMK